MLPCCLYQRTAVHHSVYGLPEGPGSGRRAHRVTMYGAACRYHHVLAELLV